MPKKFLGVLAMAEKLVTRRQGVLSLELENAELIGKCDMASKGALDAQCSARTQADNLWQCVDELEDSQEKLNDLHQNYSFTKGMTSCRLKETGNLLQHETDVCVSLLAKLSRIEFDSVVAQILEQTFE